MAELWARLWQRRATPLARYRLSRPETEDRVRDEIFRRLSEQLGSGHRMRTTGK